MGIGRKDLPSDLLHGVAHDACDALHGSDDSEDVPAACRHVGSVVVAHPCPALGKVLRVLALLSGLEHGDPGRQWQREVVFIDPAACGNVLFHVAQYDAVADDGLVLLYRLQGDLVALRNVCEGTDVQSLDDVALGRCGNDDRNVVSVGNLYGFHRSPAFTSWALSPSSWASVEFFVGR